MKRTPLNIRAEKERTYPVLTTLDVVFHFVLSGCLVTGAAYLLVQTLMWQAPNLAVRAALIATKVLG